ncbi:hypothetical protein ACMSW1_002539 [Cronobacter dublinensis]
MTNSINASHKKSLIIGAALTTMAFICIAMTCMFIYVSNEANKQIDGIRSDYRTIADRRDAKVARLSEQVADLKMRMDSLPDRTASKTADKVKQVVQEDEGK